jgi:hypothetical protein
MERTNMFLLTKDRHADPTLWPYVINANNKFERVITNVTVCVSHSE